jgi:type VI secretion system secreted protein VgrG
MALTGTLILDGQNNPDAVWVFQSGSTLTSAGSSVVSLINGAQACHVFWQVGSSATFGTSSDFTGHVLALTSITATTGATFKGQLLARNGAVTLDTNTITNDVCAAAVTPTATVSATPSSTPVVTPPTATATPSSTPTASATPSATPTEASSPSPTPVETTETGGELPNTETPWVNIIALGALVIAAGGAILFFRRKRS